MLYAALFALGIWIVYLVREIWLPLGLAFLLATVLDPVVDRMERRGFSRAMGSAIIFGGFIVFVGGALWLLAPMITEQISHIQASLAKYFPDTSPKGLQSSLRKMHMPDALARIGVSSVQGFVGGYEKSSNWLTDYSMRFVSNLVWIVIVPIVAFYALRDYHLILGKGLLLVPKRRREAFQTYVAEVTQIFAKYLGGLGLVSLMNGVATYLLLLVIRVPSALFLGVIAGVLYSVPYIGALMTIVLTAGVAFAEGGPNLALLAVGLSVVLHQIVFDQIITPRILGKQVGLHPILAIVALLAGNLLLGIIGMILAVPIAACIQIGVLALMPKLSQDIELDHNPDSLDDPIQLGEKAKELQMESSATHDLHQTVVNAVDRVEQKLAES